MTHIFTFTGDCCRTHFCRGLSVALTVVVAIASWVTLPNIAVAKHAKGTTRFQPPAHSKLQRHLTLALPASKHGYRQTNSLRETVLLIPGEAITKPSDSQLEINSALRFVISHTKYGASALKCAFTAQGVYIASFSSEEKQFVPFSALHIRVYHPIVGRTDRNGFRTPLTVWALRNADDPFSAEKCEVFSTLAVPERVPQRIWSKIDRLMTRFALLGATVDRPPVRSESLSDEAY